MLNLERIFESESKADFLANYDPFFRQFLEAIHQKDKCSFYEILSYRATPRVQNPQTGETVLHLAVRFGPLELVRRLIDLGANINAEDDNRETALHRAIERSADVVQLLLDNGADVEISDRFNVDSLQLSLLSGSIETVCLLLKKKYSIELSSSQKKVSDCEKCNKIIQICLDLNVDHNWQGYPILVHFVVKYGDEETLRLVMKKLKFIDINALNPEEQGLLHIVMVAGRADLLKIILDHGADVDQIDNKKCTALYYALLKNDLTSVRLLLDYGADVNHELKSDTTPLSYILKYWIDDSMEMLADSNVNIHGIYHFYLISSLTPLHIACGLTKSLDRPQIDLYRSVLRSYEAYGYPNLEYWLGCSPKIILLLLEKGANINAEALDGMTPLLVACRAGHLHIAHILLKFGAFLHEEALFYAVQGNNIHLVPFLIEKGANVNGISSDGMTPLLIACKNGRFDMVRILLKCGASLHERALLHAVDGRNIELVSFLIGKGYDVNARFTIWATKYRAEHVTTPFHRLFDTFDRNLNMELIEMLADNGANLGAPYPGDLNIVIKAIHYRKPEEVVCLLELKASVELPISVSPYAGLRCSHCTNQENSGISITLNQFTAFLALKEDNISHYRKRRRKNSHTHDCDFFNFLYYVKFFRKCKLEVEKLKSTRICDESQVSYFDFLAKELLVVVPFTRSEDIGPVLESLKYRRKFPCYSFLLEQRIKRVKGLKIYMNLIVEFLEKKYAKRTLTWLVFREIFSFWSISDVRNFGRALTFGMCIQTTSNKPYT